MEIILQVVKLDYCLIAKKMSLFMIVLQDNVQQRMIDTDRVKQLISGFGDYTTSASGASLGSTKKRTDQINDLADQILELLPTEEETPLQTIFVEKLAKILSSSSKSNWKQLRDSSGTLPSGRTVLGTIVDPLGLFRTSPMIQMNALLVERKEEFEKIECREDCDNWGEVSLLRNRNCRQTRSLASFGDFLCDFCFSIGMFGILRQTLS